MQIVSSGDIFLIFTENRFWYFMQIVSTPLLGKIKYFKILSAENFTQQ